jgi:protein TonB
MFEDSLFATNARRRPQRGVAAVISFGVQAVLLGALVLVPLIYTDALPLGSLKNYVEIPLPPIRPAPEAAQPVAHRQRPTTSEIIGTTLLQPPRVPSETHEIDDRGAAPPTIDPFAVIGGPIGDNRNNSALNIIASNMRAVAPPVTPSITKPRLRISTIDEGLLLHRVTPVYPVLAKQARIQGPVVMRAIVGRDGRIQNLQIVSGHPMLTKAAIEAVQQWRYRPYLLNNEPVEVETQITVNFVLGG